ncbi:MAG: hypothetical protein AABY22_25855 [Nanoarchaeota archaeon]
MSDIDEVLARELELFYENDSQLYKTETAWVINFKRKIKKGVYNSELAIKGIENNFIPMVINKYRKEVAHISDVDKATKHFMAQRFVKNFEEEDSIGEYDELNLKRGGN